MSGTVQFVMKNKFVTGTLRQFVRSWLVFALAATAVGCGTAYSPSGGGNPPPPPSITSLSPTSGAAGTPVTITGAYFGATQGTSTVTFNGTSATPTSWSATSISVPVPAGATTGSVVVTVGGVASNGVSFTVVPDTTAPVVTITAPANGATVSATITLTATATDSDSAVSFVQFLVDGANTGAQLTTAPYSISLDTTALSNATHTLTAVAQDPSGNKGTSSAVTITVSNTTSTSMGPLKKSTVNTRYFVDPGGNGVFLSGSHTWNDVQDTDQSASPAAFPFANYVSMLKGDGQNATILWRKDMPRECGWNSGTWNLQPQPWLRSTTISGASDGGNKFDLTQFNQQFFDRMHAEALTLQQNGIYAIMELFDGSNVAGYRCGTTSPTGDGYPLTGVNNINSVDDGYVSGSGGEGSFIMQTNNAVSNAEDAYVKKMLDTMNDLQNVVYELAEEQPIETSTFWIPHMYGLIKTYEAGGTWEGTTYPGEPLQHLVGVGAFSCSGNDPVLYASNVDWIAPTVTACNGAFPSNVTTNNQGKIVINDSDHALGFAAFVNSSTGAVNDALLRDYIWENITNGAAGLIFMDPYIVFWTTGQRNPCASPSSGICPAPMTKYDPFRQAMGFAQGYVNAKMDLLKATPQGSLSSTGFSAEGHAARQPIVNGFLPGR